MSDNHDHLLAQERENLDPEERIRPMPLLPVLIAVGMVIFGFVYIFMSGPYTLSIYGDQRTIADLSGPAPAVPGAAVDGKGLFAAQCAACHQATGQGLPGVFPPLDGAEWVLGEPRILANILLHGVEGELEVKGQTYQGQMPAFAQLSDAELAGIATYIRGEWSNTADAIDAALFEIERADSDRSTPFHGGDELKALAGSS